MDKIHVTVLVVTSPSHLGCYIPPGGGGGEEDSHINVMGARE